MTRSPEPVVGIVLAAGAGTRFGGPKGLARHPCGTPWVVSVVACLIEAGCSPVIVVTGAAGGLVESLVSESFEASPTPVRVAWNPCWEDGLSSSVRSGLLAARAEAPGSAAAALVPVDVPDLDARTVRRVLGDDTDRTVVRRATFGGTPGHPVVIGCAHWKGVLDEIDHTGGDAGAKRYLASHDVRLVDCSDLSSGRDVDRR